MEQRKRCYVRFSLLEIVILASTVDAVHNISNKTVSMYIGWLGNLFFFTCGMEKQ